MGRPNLQEQGFRSSGKQTRFPNFGPTLLERTWEEGQMPATGMREVVQLLASGPSRETSLSTRLGLELSLPLLERLAVTFERQEHLDHPRVPESPTASLITQPTLRSYLSWLLHPKVLLPFSNSPLHFADLWPDV